MTPRETLQALSERMNASVLGQQYVVERLRMSLLANGNVLVEGLPGLAKTRAVKSMARHLEADLSRIQFTPDLLPSDVTGTEIYHSTESGQGRFEFQAGPIFANIVLADEINRAPAKVQAALLEAMEERQVTVAGTTHRMPDLFMVMATQNPVEQEGTYPLPEAQMDRFLMHLYIEYPAPEYEVEMIHLVRGERSGKAAVDESALPQSAVFEARGEIDQVETAPALERYIVDLVDATRHPEKYDDQVAQWLQIGASPRGVLGLDICTRVHAWLRGRDHATPDDVRAVVHDVLRHRLMLSYEGHAEGETADSVIKRIVELVALP